MKTPQKAFSEEPGSIADSLANNCFCKVLENLNDYLTEIRVGVPLSSGEILKVESKRFLRFRWHVPNSGQRGSMANPL